MIAVKVENISKVYKLYDKPVDRLKESLHPLRKKYSRDFYALKNVSFQVNKGETVGIIGKNGSGKSTVLKIISGVLSSTSGKVTTNGRISSLLELGAGFNPEMTGIENIYLNGTIMGYSKEDMDKKLDSILSFADIGDFVYQPVKIYSSGMFARLAFAVAINVDPDILIVDEALSVGDIAFQAKCYRKFNDFKESGKTILFVTHAMDSILKYCDRAILLNHGKIIADNKPKEVVDIYKKIIVNCFNQDIDTRNNSQKITHNTEWKKYFQSNPNFLEYGDKSAEIIDFGIFDNENNPLESVLSDELVTFKIKVRFNKTIINPIFAVAIKDIKGTELMGTNTLYEGIDTGTFHEGQQVSISFTQRLNLRTDNYTVSFGCTNFHEDNLVVYHRLYDILLFRAISIKSLAGIYDMCSQISINK
jgi:teichoic acid transport system ATP-binding protein